MGSLHTPRRLLLLTAIFAMILVLPQVFSQASLTVTVSTNQTQYAPGALVTIFGKVVDNQSNPVVGAAVSIEVNEPPIYVQLVSSDQSGSFSDQFALSSEFPQGQYTIYVTAHKGNFTAAQQTQFTVLPQTASTTASSSTSSSQTTPPSQCFIATATYGSELSPEVSLLRNLRDKKISQTVAGRNFMLLFNSFYYSFSPQVASVISSHPLVRSAAKLLLYPLIGLLYVSDRVFTALSFNGELAVTAAGVFAAIGIGAIYVGPVAMVFCKISKQGKRAIYSGGWKVSISSCILAALILSLGEAVGVPILLSVGIVSILLSFILLGALSALRLWGLVENWKRTDFPGK